MIKCVILILANIFFNLAFDFPVNTEIETARFYFGKNIYDGIILNIGTGREKNHPSVAFFLDIGFSMTLIGDTSKIGFGIDCPGQNSCQVEPKPLEKIMYLKQELILQPAKTHISTDPEVKYDQIIEGTNRAKMDLKLIFGPEDWTFGDWGVVGLGPMSDFGIYLTRLTRKRVNLLPMFTRLNSEMEFRLFINPKINQRNELLKIVLPEKSRYWEMDASVDFSYDKLVPGQKERTCLTTHSQEIVLFTHQIERCFFVHRIICEGRFGSQCTRKRAQISKAPVLKIEIGNYSFKFEPQEYLYYEGDSIKCRFGDLSDAQLTDGCSAGTNVALGKGFMVKYPIVLGIGFEGSSTMTFLGKHKLPVRMTKHIRKLFLLGGFLVFLGCVVLAWRINTMPVRSYRSENSLDVFQVN